MSFRLLCAAMLILVCALPLQGQFVISQNDRNAVFAREEFRLGVQAYNRFAFNEAIISLEKALSFVPGEPVILDWLGRAYYRSGLEDTALEQWQLAMEAYPPDRGERLLLSNRIETIRNRRSLFTILDGEARYVSAGRYPGVSGTTTLYRQPSSAWPLPDGSLWVAAYGSNEVLHIDVNGVIRRRRRGPLNGFDRPFDIVRGQDGRLYVSEFRGGRVSVLSSEGDWLSYIGTRGTGDGQFVGPQYMTIDEDGYLYVVDYGNRRIEKFDPDGAFLLSFGKSGEGFPGFLSPTGIAALNGRIYAADGVNKVIHQFDYNGIYLGELLSEGLESPESLRVTSDGKILAADANRVFLIDPVSTVKKELGFLGNSGNRLLCADMDGNGNILAVNFQAGEVTVMTRFDEMASGLFVQIERVDAAKFPDVTVELNVQDRRRRPMVGLGEENFLITENSARASGQRLLSQGFLNRESGISLLIERSPQAREFLTDIAAAARDASAAGRLVSVVSAGETPVLERFEGRLDGAARGQAASYSPRWRFDLGLRLAATGLLEGEKRRAVVFITTGALGDLAFSSYGISDLAAYLANNGIVFYAVLVGSAPPAPEIEFLCAQTGGKTMQLYRSEGIRPVIEEVKSMPNGSYTLRYRSGLATDFGRAYLPLEAEAYILDRSGRDGIGYFAPLE